MNKTSMTGSMISLCMICVACGKHMYILNQKEVTNMIAATREPGIEHFIVYKNGDTVKGRSLKKDHKKSVDGKVRWTLDDKSIILSDIHSYRDMDGYYLYDDGAEYARVIKGKVIQKYKQRRRPHYFLPSKR